jgi:Rrf2 family protein
VGGGYRLAMPPEKISLSSVVRHIEGALAPVSCVSEKFYEKCSCPNEAHCGIRSVMKDVREAIVKILENTTVADVCQRVGQLKQKKGHAFEYII